MQVTVCATQGEVARACADRIAATLEQANSPTWILPAGSTPPPLFAELVQRHRTGVLNLGRANIFQLDELLGVDPADPRSFQYLLREHLIAPAELLPSRTNLLDGSAARPEHEIGDHARKLQACGGATLAIVGIGLNGHVAFNEPGSPLTSSARVVELADSTRRGLRQKFREPQLPTHGLTLGVSELLACEELILIATGSAKAAVLAELLQSRANADFPASQLVDHPSFRVLADSAAMYG